MCRHVSQIEQSHCRSVHCQTALYVVTSDFIAYILCGRSFRHGQALARWCSRRRCSRAAAVVRAYLVGCVGLFCVLCRRLSRLTSHSTIGLSIRMSLRLFVALTISLWNLFFKLPKGTSFAGLTMVLASRNGVHARGRLAVSWTGSSIVGRSTRMVSIFHKDSYPVCCGVWFGVRAVSVTHGSLACPWSRSSGEYVCIATRGGRSLQSSTPEGVFAWSLATRLLCCRERRSEDSARLAAGLVFRVGLVALESCQARVSELEALLESRGNVGGTLVAGMGSSPG